MQTQTPLPYLGLHDKRKASENANKHGDQTVTASKVQGRLSTALASRGRWSSCGSGTTTEASVDNTSSSTGSTCGDSGGSHGRRCGCGVDSSRILGTAWVLASAVALASGVTTASSNTLGTIFRADEVWEGLRVFGGIGRHAVSADTVISQAGRVAIIGICGG